MPSDKTLSRFSMALPAWVVRASGRLNVPVYRLTRGRIGNKVGRAPVLLLTTTGRRSGQRRTTPVLFMKDGANVVVIGSNAGNREPAWSFNLKAHADAEIEIGPARSRVRARLAAGEERDRLWQAMNVEYEGFDAYRTKAGRDDIPVFELEPR